MNIPESYAKIRELNGGMLPTEKAGFVDAKTNTLWFFDPKTNTVLTVWSPNILFRLMEEEEIKKIIEEHLSKIE